MNSGGIFSQTFTGTQSLYQNLNMNQNSIINLLDPISTQDAATKNYVDVLISDIETGAIALNFSQPNYCVFGSNTLDPEHPTQYTGTQNFLSDANISNTANINGSKILNESISNAKLITIDGSRIVDGTITSGKIANSSIIDIDIASNADILQSKILNLPTDLATIVTNISTLQSYFTTSRLNLANLNKSASNYQVLSQDLAANNPTYRQLDSNYIVSLDQSKINQNNNNQYVKYCDSTNFTNITTFINGLANGMMAIIYPFNNTAGNYTITNNDVWGAINPSIQGMYKSQNASNVNIDAFANSNTLNIGNATNVFGQYYSNLNFNCITNIKIFLNGYFENMNFNKVMNLTLAASSFVIFVNCTFNAVFNITSIGAGSTVFMNNCNFTSKTWTQTANSGTVLLANCTNLPTFTLLSGWFMAGFNGTATQSQINLSNKGFYDAATNTKYLYVSSDISASANIIGSQLSSAAGIVNGQITGLNTSKLTVDSGLTMGTNLITCTATNVNIGASSTNLITKSYADATYATSGSALLSSDNTWTGANIFNNRYFTVMNGSNSSGLFYDGAVADSFYMMSAFGDTFRIFADAGTFSGIKYNTIKYSDTFDNNLFEVSAGSTRALSTVYFRAPVKMCTSTHGKVLIGAGSNRDATSTDAVYVGGSDSGSGDSRVRIGFDDDATSGSAAVTNRTIFLGCSRTASSGITMQTSNGVFRFTNNNDYGGGGSCSLSSNTGLITVNSSLAYKSNIINKTQTYILDVNQPSKNYYTRIINCPIYSYTYKKNETEDYPQITQGPSWEYLYENFFSYCLGAYLPKLNDGGKPSMEWFDDESEERRKTVNKGSLLEYVILALQEQDKFIIQPLRAELDETKNKLNTLITYMTQNQIIPNNLF